MSKVDKADDIMSIADSDDFGTDINSQTGTITPDDSVSIFGASDAKSQIQHPTAQSSTMTKDGYFKNISAKGLLINTDDYRYRKPSKPRLTCALFVNRQGNFGAITCFEPDDKFKRMKGWTKPLSDTREKIILIDDTISVLRSKIERIASSYKPGDEAFNTDKDGNDNPLIRELFAQSENEDKSYCIAKERTTHRWSNAATPRFHNDVNEFLTDVESLRKELGMGSEVSIFDTIRPEDKGNVSGIPDIEVVLMDSRTFMSWDEKRPGNERTRNDLHELQNARYEIGGILAPTW